MPVAPALVFNLAVRTLANKNPPAALRGSRWVRSSFLLSEPRYFFASFCAANCA